MHHVGFETYRGCTAFNAGCFQSQTDYEAKQGHFPTPGIAAVVNLKTRNIALKDFCNEGKWIENKEE